MCDALDRRDGVTERCRHRQMVGKLIDKIKAACCLVAVAEGHQKWARPLPGLLVAGVVS
jgi:hypothetical protein